MKIGIMGAGSIGCYVGGRLIAAGVDTVLVGRPSLAAEVAAHGMRLTDLHGFDLTLPPARVAIATEPGALAGCDVVLLTVKGGDTQASAALLGPVLRHDALLVSFQNGVNNAEVLRAALPGRAVLAGMVPFNVLRREGAYFHQGTSGTLAVERSRSAAEQPLVRALAQAGLPAAAHEDMLGVMWGKLIVNLNNSVNALSGVTILEQLASRDYRRVMAACVREGLQVLAAAGIKPKVDIPLPPRLVPFMLTLPDVLFRLAARSMMRIDPQARSSMWDDLERGRKTEIDALNGEVVRLAQRLGLTAPINAAVVQLVKAAEGHGSPRLDGRTLREKISAG